MSIILQKTTTAATMPGKRAVSVNIYSVPAKLDSLQDCHYQKREKKEKEKSINSISITEDGL